MPDYDIQPYVPNRKMLRVMYRTAQFGLAAAQMAVTDAGESGVERARKGAFIGTGQALCPGEFMLDSGACVAG